MEKSRTLRVTGVGSAMAEQNMTRLTITLKDSCATYNEAITTITESSQLLRETLMNEQCGFAHEDIKTISFDIRRLEKRYDKTLTGEATRPTFLLHLTLFIC